MHKTALSKSSTDFKGETNACLTSFYACIQWHSKMCYFDRVVTQIINQSTWLKPSFNMDYDYAVQKWRVEQGVSHFLIFFYKYSQHSNMRCQDPSFGFGLLFMLIEEYNSKSIWVSLHFQLLGFAYLLIYMYHWNSNVTSYFVSLLTLDEFGQRKSNAPSPM